MSFNTIPEILEDIRACRMVVMFDDEDRENEDDLIMSAQRVRPRRPATLANLTIYDPPPSFSDAAPGAFLDFGSLRGKDAYPFA